jgi:hypothetical protein
VEDAGATVLNPKEDMVNTLSINDEVSECKQKTVSRKVCENTHFRFYFKDFGWPEADVHPLPDQAGGVLNGSSCGYGVLKVLRIW